MQEYGGLSNTIHKRIKRVQDEIMGNEGLINALDDVGASELLSWGLKRAEQIATLTDGMDEDAAELSMSVHLKSLRKIMRHLGRLISEGNELDNEGRLWLWMSVQKHVRIIYGDKFQIPPLNHLMDRISHGEAAGQILSNISDSVE